MVRKTIGFEEYSRSKIITKYLSLLMPYKMFASYCKIFILTLKFGLINLVFRYEPGRQPFRSREPKINYERSRRAEINFC